MDINLRLESRADYFAVEALTREAFWNSFWEVEKKICDEHLLLRKLRECEAFVPELSYVAAFQGKIVGHIIYSKSKIVGDSGESHETLTFGPLSVLPEYQGQGIGKALTRHTFAEAKRLGYRAVIIFGHPDYYPRLGFRPAREFGIVSSGGEDFDAFMAYPLYDGALDGISGRYSIDPVYESLTQEEALVFDRQFPPKERHIPVSIDVLLNRLDQAARRAFTDREIKSLAWLSGVSGREMLAWEGMNERAMAVVNQCLAEYGLPQKPLPSFDAARSERIEILRYNAKNREQAEAFSRLLADYFLKSLLWEAPEDQVRPEDIPEILDSITALLRLPRYWVCLCRREEEIIGFIIAQIDDPEKDWCKRPGWGLIREAYIEPAYRNRGYARRMVAFVEALIAKNGAENMYLTADTPGFWERVGYVHRGEVDEDNGCAVYEKKLL